MMTLFNFDFTNPTHTQVFAQVCALATQAGVPMQVMGAGVSDMGTQVQASTPTQTQAPKVYAPAEDVACQWLVDKTRVTYALANGKYAGQSGVRKTLNARLREAGATWDADKKAWVFKSTAAAKKFVEADVCAHYDTLDGIEYPYPTIVTAQEIEAVRAKAQARAEKKANKSA